MSQHSVFMHLIYRSRILRLRLQIHLHNRPIHDKSLRCHFFVFEKPSQQPLDYRDAEIQLLYVGISFNCTCKSAQRNAVHFEATCDAAFDTVDLTMHLLRL